MSRLPTVDFLRGDSLPRNPAGPPEQGPYVVGRLAADGSMRAVLQRRLSWLRACRLLEGLPDDYVMRIEPDYWKQP